VLFGSTFENTDLTRTNLEIANLQAAVFDQAILRDTRLGRSDARKGTLIDGQERDGTAVYREIETSFREAELNGANFQDASLRNVNFSSARLDNVNLRGADLGGARFHGADISNLDISKALIQDADFRSAAFDNVILGESGLILAATAPMKPIERKELETIIRRHEVWVESGGREGTRASFAERNLAGHDLSGHNLATVSFDYANLRGVRLCRTVLAACSFHHANLRAADLAGSDLRGADLSSSVITGANLAGCDIGVLPRTGLDTRFPEA
jgi:uncharacterized protein YjbI with pentapeptide repeats